MEFLDQIEAVLGDRPVRTNPLTGGSIGQVQLVTMADDSRMVVKTARQDDSDLTIEAYMLRYLSQHSSLPVPSVIYDSQALLILDYQEGSSQFTEEAERDAARHLASLHDIQAPRFGLERDTLIGAFRQPNPWQDSWISFFAEQRLLYMGQLCLDVERLPPTYMERLHAFCSRLNEWLLEPPAASLLHGDIWATNVLASEDRVNSFLDPAIYYGHPEVELAYITLFGTFTEAFFREYQSLSPLPPGFFETRRHVYNLYPLLVHVRHFGGSYLNSVDRTLARFGF